MTARRAIAVIGASGFIGRSVAAALERHQVEMVPIRAPRLPPITGGSADYLRPDSHLVRDLAARLAGVAAVVNAAGIADAAATEEPILTAANSLLPGLVGRAAKSADVTRVIHISSAAVQGRIPVLDSAEVTHPFSPYSKSKAVGESFALRHGPTTTVVYRPAGVHGIERAVTRSIARIARSRLACVAEPGDANSPQALIENVADAVAFLATTELTPPRVVHHPTEGITTTLLLKLLGGNDPAHIPAMPARSLVSAGRAAATMIPSMAAHVRRLEMLWFGQAQATSWLSQVGWRPPSGMDAWREIGRVLAEQDSTHNPGRTEERGGRPG